MGLVFVGQPTVLFQLLNLIDYVNFKEPMFESGVNILGIIDSVFAIGRGCTNRKDKCLHHHGHDKLFVVGNGLHCLLSKGLFDGLNSIWGCP